ncbi:unnamed protein product (macronuclear) [Paramecium tetraurelia]|uniref:Protein kinase domain-containing protein n=1 Tax=Paramecium tetraurelia TaxID=5888 RepID=A0D049_PARTE|nr:uncharacterized protein GSPATT00011968001 [Paramecium tetraurelia]CAK76416.1 unnamed protein product [Paramecium tetraurelia]|eukprot:XP_001443813.1 hypothetical protein (macronuclear) [Paramecium tetraurelia strain d4-2]
MNEQIAYIEDFYIDFCALLGQGACGKVFAANRKNDTKQYCAKIVNGNSQNVQKELDILNFMKNKQNENIVNVYYSNFVPDKGFFVIIMEKCDSDLEKEIKSRGQQRRYTEQEAIEIMKQLFNGYRVLYQSQVIHRDIKPANILTSQGKYKIADFGVGKIYQSDQNLLNITKNGTPVFKAPELQGNYEYSPSDILYIQGNQPRFSTNPSPLQGSTMQGNMMQGNMMQGNMMQGSIMQQGTMQQNAPFKGTFDDKEKKVKLLHKVDIYSFGILFYHLLTGTYPFELSMSGINDFIQRLKITPFKIPPQFNISPSTCQLIERMITYSPVERIDFPSLSSWYGLRLGTMYNRDSAIMLPVKMASITFNPPKIVMILPQKSVQDWIQQYRLLFIEKCCESQIVIPIYRNYCDLCLNLAIMQFEQTITIEQIIEYIQKYQQANKCDIEFKIEAKLDRIFYIQEYCRVLKNQFIPKCFDYEQIKTYGETHLKFMFITSKLLKGYYNIQSLLGPQPPNYNAFKDLISKDIGLTKEQYKQYLDDQF